MKKFSRLLVMLLLSIALAVFLTNCGSGGGGGGDDSGSSGTSSVSGCAWFGSASSRAPEGAFECSGNTMVKCVNGIWATVVNCTSTYNSDDHYCTCKGGLGMNTTECSWGFKKCGYSYETCGDNAHSELADVWQCVEE